jgi:hypothetical protein
VATEKTRRASSYARLLKFAFCFCGKGEEEEEEEEGNRGSSRPWCKFVIDTAPKQKATEPAAGFYVLYM